MNHSKQKALTKWVFQLDKETGRLTIWEKIDNDILPMKPVATLKKQAWGALIRFLKT